MKTVIGRNLKSLRTANGYTQEKVSEFLGINRSAYANYESGEREAPLEILEKAVALFGCELGLLFEEDKNVVDEMLTCAFRADDINTNDMKEIAEFKNLVLNYLKMGKLLAE